MNNGCHVAKNSRIKQAWDNHHAETKNLNRKSLKYKALCCLKKYIQGVHEKLCFFTIHCNPSLAYIAVRDLQSSQRRKRIKKNFTSHVKGGPGLLNYIIIEPGINNLRVWSKKKKLLIFQQSSLPARYLDNKILSLDIGWLMSLMH